MRLSFVCPQAVSAFSLIAFFFLLVAMPLAVMGARAAWRGGPAIGSMVMLALAAASQWLAFLIGNSMPINGANLVTTGYVYCMLAAFAFIPIFLLIAQGRGPPKASDDSGDFSGAGAVGGNSGGGGGGGGNGGGYTGAAAPPASDGGGESLLSNVPGCLIQGCACPCVPYVCLSLFLFRLSCVVRDVPRSDGCRRVVPSVGFGEHVPAVLPGRRVPNLNGKTNSFLHNAPHVCVWFVFFSRHHHADNVGRTDVTQGVTVANKRNMLHLSL